MLTNVSMIFRGKANMITTAWQMCKYGVSVLYFPAFGLNTERYRVSLCIQSECAKIRTKIAPNTETFHAVRSLQFLFPKLAM